MKGKEAMEEQEKKLVWGIWHALNRLKETCEELERTMEKIGTDNPKLANVILDELDIEGLDVENLHETTTALYWAKDRLYHKVIQGD